MPHAAMYQTRQMRQPIHEYHVSVADEAGFQSEFDIHATNEQAARREAIRLHAAERGDVPVSAWARVH
ncbi:MAG: hypothetical protein V4641_05800 [Pseudomonadota bacterium]